MTGIIPNISVDCVVFGFDGESLNVLLIEREMLSPTGEIVFKDHTLTGYHINQDENLDQAANHILFELTGLKNIYLEQVFSFGDTNRLMRDHDQQWIKYLNRNIDNRTITIVYYALIDNTKVELSETKRKASWYPVHDLPELGYDHNEIIDKAMEVLRVKAKMEPIVFELLQEKFTLTQMQKAYEAVLDTQFDRRNFRKKVAQMRFIVSLNEKQKGVAHKPAQLYFFSREVYERTKKDSFVISI
jgi:8-oxo-dGTP diphosphatase